MEAADSVRLTGLEMEEYDFACSAVPVGAETPYIQSWSTVDMGAAVLWACF